MESMAAPSSRLGPGMSSAFVRFRKNGQGLPLGEDISPTYGLQRNYQNLAGRYRACIPPPYRFLGRLARGQCFRANQVLHAEVILEVHGSGGVLFMTRSHGESSEARMLGLSSR